MREQFTDLSPGSRCQSSKLSLELQFVSPGQLVDKYVWYGRAGQAKNGLLEHTMSAESSRDRQAGRRRFRHGLHLFPGRFTRPGTAPGNLSHPPQLPPVPATLYLLDFDASGLTKKADCTLEEAREYFSSPRATWLHVQGTPSEALLRSIGDAYRLHPLALEDVLHTGQRAKVETYDDELFAVLGIPQFAG
jgi:Mg2+ and Co2+ transporter CorA